jgi:NAD(P)-dependent dehydrogenase (short-subunit alcohol dehydrogenase family)
VSPPFRFSAVSITSIALSQTQRDPTMRNPEKEMKLATLSGVVLFPLDITERHQIDSAATRAVTRGSVDVVFNNAG